MAVPQTPRSALAIYLQKLKVVVAHKDHSDEPLAMIPDMQAAIICTDTPSLDPFERSYGAGLEIARAFDA